MKNKNSLSIKKQIAVIGAGAWGGWTAYQLLQKGAEVTLIDAWGAGNARSGSGGESRIIRLGYGADKIYVDMAARAYEIWEDFFQKIGHSFYLETGVLWLFPESAKYMEDCAPFIKAHGQKVEELSIYEAKKRFPQFNYEGIKTTWFEHRAGALEARNCCLEVVKQFVKEGGRYIQAWAKPNEYQNHRLKSITLSSGEKIEADQFVFAGGPWTKFMFPEVLNEIINISRQEIYYFGVPADNAQYFSIPNMPIWLNFDLDKYFYGIPNYKGKGFKIAYDVRDEPFDPFLDDRNPNPKKIQIAKDFIAKRFPDLKGMPLVEARVCQYENSLDGHFLFDYHKDYQNVILMVGSSGHGFKMGPAIGEMMAQHLLDGVELNPFFSFKRLEGISKNVTQFSTQKRRN